VTNAWYGEYFAAFADSTEYGVSDGGAVTDCASISDAVSGCSGPPLTCSGCLESNHENDFGGTQKFVSDCAWDIDSDACIHTSQIGTKGIILESEHC
jgi:hypothetical protein